MIAIKECEVCDSKELHEILNLGFHPMCDDLVPINSERIPKEYPIEIVFCETCKTAHQKYQIPKQELFPQTYHYRSRHTADVLNGMKELVSDVTSKFGTLQGKKVLDIGCNDGSLLDFFKMAGAETFGIEPTGAYIDAEEKGHRVVHDFITSETAQKFLDQNGCPDVITFTNVFAHIEDLKGLVASLKVLVGPKTIIVIENHYLGAVLDKFQFDTFYHEHPRTYSLTSFKYIAKSLGMTLFSVDFPKRYGGNIRVILSKDSNSILSDEITKVENNELLFGERLQKMNREIEQWRVEKLKEINDAVKHYGKLSAKAFPGRAAIPVKMLGLNDAQVESTYEKPTSGKIGHFIPGTRIPILSDDELTKKLDKLPVLLNLAWHIETEIDGYLRQKGFKGKLINII